MTRTCAVLGVLLSLVGGPIGHVAQLVAALAIALMVGRPRDQPTRLGRCFAVACWVWIGVDLFHAVGSDLELVAHAVGYGAVVVGAWSAVATLGAASVRPMARTAGLAAVLTVGLVVEPTDLAGAVVETTVLLLGVFAAALWVEFSVVRRRAGVVVALCWGSVVALIGGLAFDAVVGESVLAPASTLALVGRLLMVLAITHPRFPELLRNEEGDCERVASAQVAVSIVMLLVAAAAASARLAAVPGSPTWQALLPVPVVAVAAAHTRSLHRKALRDNDALRRTAMLDPTTGLHNERGLLEHLAEHTGRPALVVVQLDGFRALLRRLDPVDALELARACARRLERAAATTAVVARCDTDEFVVVTAGDPMLLARDVQASLGEELFLSASSVSAQITVRIGWSVVDEADPVAALHEARFAAQEAAAGEVVRFADAERERYRIQRMLLKEFPAAVRSGQVVAHYQPIVEVHGGRITSFEVLARWTHPELGPVSPGVFIPLAESSGAIVALGERLLRTACEQLAAWRRLPGHESLGLTVNLSPRQLADAQIEAVVMAALADNGLPPEALTLELTEGMLADLDVAPQVLRDLQRLGVGVAVDDFGTGYSSMAYLDELRPDIVKVDRRFTQALTSPGGDVARGVFSLLRGLGLPVVAEGVEDAETLAALMATGSDRWQGFLHSRPMPADAASELLAQGRAPGAPSSIGRASATGAARGPGARVEQFVRPAVVVDDTCTWQDVEQLFLDDARLGTVVVRRDDGSYSTLTAAHVRSHLTGPAGVGGSRDDRAALRSCLGAPTRPIPSDMRLLDAVAVAMARPLEDRYGDLLVVRDETVGLVAVSTLMAALANDLAELASRDDLTGLPNRRHLVATLGDWVGQGVRVALLHVDLDGFGPVNDQHGQAAGDAVLTAVANRLRSCARGGDVVARLGGDEFAVALRDVDDGTVGTVADRILAVLDVPVEWEGRSLATSASVGRAAGRFDDPDAAIAAAEASMHEAKGRPGSTVGSLATARTQPDG